MTTMTTATAPTPPRESESVFMTPSHHRLALALCCAAHVLSAASFAHAENPAVSPLALAPGHGVASSDDADSIVRNAANLGFLTAFDLRYTGLFCPAGSVTASCGHGFGLAAPVFAGLAAGMRYDYLQSVSSVPSSYANEVGWLSWALAVAPSRQLSFGVAMRRAYSESATLDKRYGLASSLSWRPSSYLGFSVVGNDLNASGDAASGVTPWLERSATFALAARPLGSDSVDIGVEAKRYGTTPGWFVRATSTFAVPYVGRLRIEAEDRAGSLLEGRWAVFAGLDLGFGPSSVGGGARIMPGDDQRLTTVVTASVAGVRDEGLPMPERAVRLRIDAAPSNRGHVTLLRKLWSLSERRDVVAVALDLHADPASTGAHAEELADALRVLKARGKKVICAIEDGSMRALHVCADAHKITLMRGGNLRWSGMRAQYIYLADALDRLGIHWEYERYGAHKTAPEQFGRTTGSAEAHADYTAVLQGQEGSFVRAVARGRNLTPAAVRALAAQGPLTSDEAKSGKLVDALAYDDELELTVSEVVGRKVHLAPSDDDDDAPHRFGAPHRVAILWIDGDILDGKSSALPFVGMHSAGSDTIAEAARLLEDDPTVGAVVVRIESPGGSTVASEKIWHALSRLAKRKPLVASLGSMAASGGYYAAVACPAIVASPATVTGSIGVYFGKPEVSALLTRLGIGIDTYRTAPRADAETIVRPFTAEERSALREKIGQTYDLFLHRVSAGRKLDRAAVDAVAQGRVWTGQDAQEQKLVDHLGGFREAVDLAYALGHVARHAPMIELPRATGSLLQQAFGTLTSAPRPMNGATIPLTRELRRIARASAPLWLHDASAGLLRSDFTDNDEGDDDMTELP